MRSCQEGCESIRQNISNGDRRRVDIKQPLLLVILLPKPSRFPTSAMLKIAQNLLTALVLGVQLGLGSTVIPLTHKCTEGATFVAELTGSMQKIAGVDTYVSLPTGTYNSKQAVILLTGKSLDLSAPQLLPKVEKISTGWHLPIVK